MTKYVREGDDGKSRCWWCGDDVEYVHYHDTEWGVPQHDDRRLFEKLCLEGFQAGLSWLTILRKRAAFREAFDEFDIQRVARYRPGRVDKLLTNAGIVRHRGKIEATINNAKRALALQDEFGSLDTFFWQYQPQQQRRFDPKRAVTPESTEMSKALRKRDWKFVGPTTCYSFMQSMGIVDDHHPQCFRKA